MLTRTLLHTTTVPYGDVTLRVVVLYEATEHVAAYVAHALEKDIAAFGPTPDGALRRLRFTAALDHEREASADANIRPAPEFVHEWHRLASSH